jgi:hypothetical protein
MTKECTYRTVQRFPRSAGLEEANGDEDIGASYASLSDDPVAPGIPGRALARHPRGSGLGV